MANHTYEAKIRLDGKVSTTQVQASDAGHAKKLVQAQFPISLMSTGTETGRGSQARRDYLNS